MVKLDNREHLVTTYGLVIHSIRYNDNRKQYYHHLRQWLLFVHVGMGCTLRERMIHVGQNGGTTGVGIQTKPNGWITGNNISIPTILPLCHLPKLLYNRRLCRQVTSSLIHTNVVIILYSTIR
jgi:hypothetical protein